MQAAIQITDIKPNGTFCSRGSTFCRSNAISTYSSRACTALLSIAQTPPGPSALTSPLVASGASTVTWILFPRPMGGFRSLYEASPFDPDLARRGNRFVSSCERSYLLILGAMAGHRISGDTEAIVRIKSILGIPLSYAGGLAEVTNTDMHRLLQNRFVTDPALAFVRAKSE